MFMSDLQKEVHDFLQTNRLTFKKSLGQHFLISRNILHTIIQAANIQPDDHIVEIGPGIGILTRELLKQTKHVTAIEIDTSLIPLLKAFTSGHSLEIINNDALRTAFPAASYKIVANIPYHITSPLLRHAFVESNPPTSLTLLIQKEVAEKICLPVRSSEGAKAGAFSYVFLCYECRRLPIPSCRPDKERRLIFLQASLRPPARTTGCSPLSPQISPPRPRSSPSRSAHWKTRCTANPALPQGGASRAHDHGNGPGTGR